MKHGAAEWQDVGRREIGTVISDDEDPKTIATSRGALPELAGKHVQAAIVSVELDHRQPVAVTRVEYDVWYLDKGGLLSERREQELARAAVESLPVLVALSRDPLNALHLTIVARSAAHAIPA